jgi:uncharacterized membrane protein
MSNLNITIPLAVHILATVVWVGGMFAAYVCLRPAAGALEGPHRLTLWRGFFAKFFVWVWISVAALLGSGFFMIATTFGGFGKAPFYVNLMQTLGLVMVALFFFLFHSPWLKFKRAVDEQKWDIAGRELTRIRDVVRVNLVLGLIVTVIGGTGRFW